MSKTINKKLEKDNKIYKEVFDTLIKTYLENKNENSQIEIEFGINQEIPIITKMEYDQLIMDLSSYGFTIDNKKGEQILYIYPESEKEKMNNQIYIKIYGIDYIEQYCKTDSIITLKSSNIKIKEKERKYNVNDLVIKKKIKSIESFKSNVFNEFKDDERGRYIIPFMDFNFEVCYKEEEIIKDINDESMNDIMNNWKTTKKFFCHLNRIKMKHKDFPLSVYLSVMKTSSFGRNGNPILKTTLLDSGIFEEIETYNIKIKLDNEEFFKFKKIDIPMQIIRKTIRFVLCTLQNTNYPISQREHNELQNEYLKLILQREYKTTLKVKSNNFIGPSTFTLLIDNIMELDEMGEETSGIPNIRKNYAVTDKADGERKLLFIKKNGYIYLISTNMQISFTGLITNNKELFNSILDGEYIKKDKFGKITSMFFAFDIYFINNEDIRHLPFYEYFIDIKESKENNRVRYKMLSNFVTNLNPISKENNILCNMKINVKLFLFSEPNNYESIFQKSKEMLAIVNNKDSYEYNRDGMIYTPIHLGVGQNNINDPILNRKVAWSRSLKWKPPEYNTIDFYVTIKKGEHNNDLITTEYNETDNIITYKTLILRCGFNEDTDGYINPYQDMIDGRILYKSDRNNNYKPYPFIPITPIDMNAQYANISIDDNLINPKLITEDGDSFEEHTIVEFRYDIEKPPLWRWIPIRVRYDKTYKLKHGEKEYGNSFKTANSIWKSIHFPITEEMISTGGDTIPKILDDQIDSYYNRKAKTLDTKPLRDFHNLFVKTNLILSVSNILSNKSNLIDFAVGKAGDIPKWIKGGFGFVLGIDIDENNIKNRRDGACARYLNNKKDKIYNLPLAFFLVGDVTLPIKGNNDIKGNVSWDCFPDINDRKIAQVIFGDEKISIKDSSLGQGVLKLHNRAKGGFSCGSCQFALHYFFESKEKIHGFLQNVTENIVKDGYFIATCYDGKTVFDFLNENNINFQDSFVLRKDNKRIFEITRMYHETGFPDNELSIGYGIDIYQESINNTIREYLVNANYLIKLMEEYGFILCPSDDLNKMNWVTDSSTGMFSELFKVMNKINNINPIKINTEYKNAIYLSPEEKIISFLNRYYIFKKVRDVNVTEIHKLYLNTIPKINKEPVIDKPILRRLPNVKKFTIETKKADFIE